MWCVGAGKRILSTHPTMSKYTKWGCANSNEGLPFAHHVVVRLGTGSAQGDIERASNLTNGMVGLESADSLTTETLYLRMT